MRRRVFVLVVLFSLMAVAAGNKPQPKTFDFTQALLGLDGKAIQRGEPGKLVSMTLGDAAVEALETITEDDRGLSGAKKFERDQLARKVYGQKTVVLSVEELALIKERVGKVYGPLVVGSVWRLLDQSIK